MLEVYPDHVNMMMADFSAYLRSCPSTNHRGKYATAADYCAARSILLPADKRAVLERTLCRMTLDAGLLAIPKDDPDLLRVYAWPLAVLDDWWAEVKWRRQMLF